MAHAGFGDYVSADSHVTEPEEAYADIDPRFKDRAPTLAHLPGQGATIIVDPGGPGEAYVPFGRIAAAGRTLVERADGWRWDELHPGGYDAQARLKEQTADGFAAEVVFPSVGMVLCNHPELDYKKACFDAYNRWIAEWCSADPSRLLGVGQTAVRTPEEGMADLEVIKGAGLRGVMLPGYPGTEQDWHDPMYDPFWDAVVDLGLPVSFHILTSGEGRRWRGPGLNGFLGVFHANQDLLGTLIFGGVFDRHPDLRVVCVEADAGWAPHFMFRMDTLYARHHRWVGKTQVDARALPPGVAHSTLGRLPSDYFRDNIYLTFQDDQVALRCLDLLNVDRLLWANDHPHSDATWPNSQAMAETFAAIVGAAELDRIVRDNCAELYGIAGVTASASGGAVRLPGASRETWSEPVRQILDAALERVGGMVADVVAAEGGRSEQRGTGNPLPTLSLIAHHEPLLGPFLTWAAALALEGPLSPRRAELVALRTSYVCGSLFEWQEHAAYGLAAGMSPEELDAIAAGPEDPSWIPLERALLQAADELHADATVSDATWATLAGELSPAELVGVTLIAGQYRMLSGLANAAGVDHALRGALPAGRPARAGGADTDDLLGLGGTVALVTGGARSFGRAIAVALASAGCDIAILDVADGSSAVQAVEAVGRAAMYLSVDVRDAGAVRRAVDAVVTRFGRLDVGVNTVGSTTGPRPFLDLTSQEWDAVHAQNSTTALLCTQAEALAMIGLGIAGRIVNVASLSGIVGAPNAAGYGAANAGVVHLTGTAAIELARYGIRVNCIVPGTHLTEAVEEAVAKDPAIAEWVRVTGAATPLGRLGTMREAAGVVLFLASRLSSYVTGQAIVEDGGMVRTTARPPMGLDREADAVRSLQEAAAAAAAGAPRDRTRSNR